MSKATYFVHPVYVQLGTDGLQLNQPVAGNASTINRVKPLVPPAVCSSRPLLAVWDLRFSLGSPPTRTDSWSLPEFAALDHSSQCGICGFLGLTANSQHLVATRSLANTHGLTGGGNPESRRLGREGREDGGGGPSLKKWRGRSLPWALIFVTFVESPQRVRLTRLLELLRLLSGSARRSCGCRCFTVGKVAIVLGVDEADVLEVSGQDTEAKHRERRGLCGLGRFGRCVLGYVFARFNTPQKSDRPDPVLALSLDDLTLWHAELRSSGNILLI